MNTRPAEITVDCHRRLRGPYSGLGSVLRALVPEIARHRPELLTEHAIEIVAITPDLADLVDVPPETLTELATKDERTRLYARTHTARLANGVIDLLLAWTATSGPCTLSFRNTDHADPTDQEFLTLLERRAADQIEVHSKAQDHPDNLPDNLHDDLPGLGDPGDPIRAFVQSDGTTPEPQAYRDADPAVRAALHDERAAELVASGEWSLRLGAIPYHLEHGGDPAAAVKALREALDHCLFRGFYDAVIDLGLRGQAVGDPDDGLDYWYLSGRTAIGYAALGQSDEAEAINLDVRRRCVVPSVHMVTSYALAMLYTRHRVVERRDHGRAKEYINNAIAIASWWPDPEERTFHTVFNHNGLALVEMHIGDLGEALRLVTEGLARLNAELQTSAYLLHRSVLMHNRANVLLRLGRVDEALRDFGSAIEADPNYPEYYFDRAGALRRLGRPADALADYDTAVSLALPFWELHYNRAAVRAEVGDLPGAIADFARVVDLEPAQLEPWVNLVSLLLEAADLAGARDRLATGLSFHPGDPQLLCARAQVSLEEGLADQAWRDFDLALAADGGLISALAGRAALAYEAADHDSAIRDLSRAIEAAGEDPDLLFNRAQVYREVGDFHAAIGDYTKALDLPGADQGELLQQREQCYASLGESGVGQSEVPV